jgi:hypothetical protein
VNAYADALAPVFRYLVPFIAIAFRPRLFLKQISLSDVAGLVARGEAISGDEAELLEVPSATVTRTPRTTRDSIRLAASRLPVHTTRSDASSVVTKYTAAYGTASPALAELARRRDGSGREPS